MTDRRDDSIGLGDIADTDAVLEQLLDGHAPGAHAPAWWGDVALLVRAAQAPATDDELAGEDDVVRRMLAVRLALDAAGAGAPDATADLDRPVPAVPAAAGDVTVLSDYRAGHTPARAYRAKHAAARLEASRHPAVRTLGQVIAMKAAAVTTAMVIGVAAAAATTGIVATVVVPALSSNEPREPAPPATTERPDRGGGTDEPGGRAPAPPDRLPLVTCPLLPACVAAEGSAPTSATTRPTTSTSNTTETTVADPAVAPTETTSPPSSTTTIAPTVTTVPETPTTTTTTTVPEDPGPVTPMSVPDGDDDDGGATGASATETSSPTSTP